MIKLLIFLFLLVNCSSSPVLSNKQLSKMCSNVANFEILETEKIGVAAKEKSNYGVYGYFKFNKTKEYTHYKTIVKVKSLGVQEFTNCSPEQMRLHEFKKYEFYIIKISDKKMTLIKKGDVVAIKLWLDFDGGAYEWDNGRLIKIF